MIFLGHFESFIIKNKLCVQSSYNNVYEQSCKVRIIWKNWVLKIRAPKSDNFGFIRHFLILPRNLEGSLFRLVLFFLFPFYSLFSKFFALKNFSFLLVFSNYDSCCRRADTHYFSSTFYAMFRIIN